MIHDCIKKLEVTVEIISYSLLLSIVLLISLVFLLEILAYISSSAIDFVSKYVNLQPTMSTSTSAFVYEVNRGAKFRMIKFSNSGTAAYRTLRKLISVKKKAN